jgi:transglutaminase-like putative cysteine protease
MSAIATSSTTRSAHDHTSKNRTSIIRVLSNTRFVPIALSMALSVLAATSWSAIFPANSLTIPALVSVLFPSVAVALTRKQGALITIASSVVALFVAAHASILRSWTVSKTGLPSGTSLRLFGDAFRNGWSRILTSPIPMSFDPDRSLVFVLTVVAGTFVGVFFAARTRFILASIAGPALILFASRLLGATASGNWASRAVALGIATAGLAGLTAKKQLGSSRTGVRRTNNRQAAGAGVEPKHRISVLSFRGHAPVALLMVTLIGALIIGVLVPASKGLGKPFDPRRVASTRNTDVTAVHPLSYVAYWAQHPTDQLFEIRSTTKQPLPLRWRIAVLDRFDGVTWLPETRYVENGSVLPSPPASIGIDATRAVDAVRAQVTIKQLPDRWLPTPGWPTSVSGVPIEVDARHGMIQQRNGATRAGLTYSIDARPLLDETPLLQSGFDTSAESLSMLEVPNLSPDLANIARTIAAGATTAQERVQRLAVYLQTRFRFNENAQPGHGYARLERLIRNPGPNGDGGTSEQFASAFAVMARSLGIPTRLVIGFAVDPTTVQSTTVQSTAGQPTINGASTTATVQAVQAQAWPEVRFDKVGWVPFFPTPLIGAETPVQDPVDQPAGSSTADTTIAAPDTVASPAIDSPQAEQSTGLSGWILGLGIVSLCLAGALFLARGTVLRRQRTRRALTERDAVFGAWDETVRTLAACKQEIRNDETLHSFAERCAGDPRWDDEKMQFVVPSMRQLADVCQSAQYRRELPATDEVSQAWTSADEIQRALMDTASIKERVRILFDARV